MDDRSRFRHPSRTPQHTMKLRRLSDGLVIERSPVDGQEAVAGGGYEFVAADTPSVPEILAELSEAELIARAREAGVRFYNERRVDIIGKLVPKIEAGRVSLP